jgi:hypothetical protein
VTVTQGSCPGRRKLFPLVDDMPTSELLQLRCIQNNEVVAQTL